MYRIDLIPGLGWVGLGFCSVTLITVDIKCVISIDNVSEQHLVHISRTSSSSVVICRFNIMKCTGRKELIALAVVMRVNK